MHCSSALVRRKSTTASDHHPRNPTPATSTNGRLQTLCWIVKVASNSGKPAWATPKALKRPGSGRLIRYARVFTEDQGTDPQLDELRGWV